ncbi:hypothetical protein QOZ95_004072 [Paenibacillus brasilensis]|uniref:Uncharacterized protein n=1 Tax=Paenibacillus brasilensis TaxID=128574 RepID=A0ABU0L3M2_9BACL|nr:hypothetical protein WG8_0445 [Paenibacillus sp. Aloe-11]MDQ0495889.1 hypothetical protein [Paenibacillus brasilensis]
MKMTGESVQEAYSLEAPKEQDASTRLTDNLSGPCIVI